MKNNRFKTLCKNAKKHSLFGQRAKRERNAQIFAVGVLAIMAGLFLACGGFVLAGVTLATAMGGIIIPQDVPLTPEERKGMEGILKSVNEAIERKGEASLKEINQKWEAFIAEHGEKSAGVEALKEELNNLGLELKKMQEPKLNAGQNFAEQVKDFISSESFKTAMTEQRRQSIEIKAASPMLTTTLTNGIVTQELTPGIMSAPQEQPSIFQALSKGKTTSRIIRWVNRNSATGGSAFIAEGTLKPIMAWDWTEEISNAKKVAVTTKLSREMLSDFIYVQDEINTVLKEDLLREVEEKLLTGTGQPGGAGVEPFGIIPNAVGYAGSSLDGTIVDPNTADCVRAGILQMRTLNFTPDIIFMHPSDVASLDLSKTSDGHYLKIELDAIMKQVRVVESTFVPVGEGILMDSKRWQVKEYEALRLEFGFENDDFTKNLITVVAELRLHSYRSSVDAGAATLLIFATVKTALQKA